MRIHMIGASGSGKTHFAKALSEKHHIPHYDLDNLFWDNTATQYGVKTPPAKRDALLGEIARQPDWVVEGVYCSWVTESFLNADIILVLETAPVICNFRIVRRFIRRKCGLEQGKKETIRSLVNLLKWNRQYCKEKLPKLHVMLHDYAKKIIFLHSQKEVYNYLNHL